MPQPAEDVHDPVWVGLPLEQGQEVDWKTTSTSPSRNINNNLNCGEKSNGAGRTVLSELCGRELRGDPEGLLGAALEDEAGGDAGAAGEVLFTAGQAQVEGVVTERGVLVALRTVTWTNSSHTS